MRCPFAWGVALLVNAVTTAGADTLADVLRANGLSPPATLPDLDRQLGSRVVTQEGGETVIVYDVGDPGGSARLVGLRLGPGGVAWTRVPLTWPPSAPRGLDAETCRRLDSARRHRGGMLVTAHVNPSAACTLVLGRDFALRAVLAGWPVATLPDGRIVYQKNQIHFSSVHPVALDLFDPARLAGTPLYPRKPYQVARTAHAVRMRQAYTEAWCSAHNHPCDPDVFDEHLASDVLVDARGDALVFVVAFDNTTGWPDAERWGRLEPFRELRMALGRWDGQGEPPEALARSLVEGLGRARNLNAGPHVAAALSGDTELRELVRTVLESPPSRWHRRGPMAGHPRRSLAGGRNLGPARAPHRRPRRAHRGRLRLRRSPDADPDSISRDPAAGLRSALRPRRAGPGAPASQLEGALRDRSSLNRTHEPLPALA